jgi:hypothetical protein
MLSPDKFVNLQDGGELEIWVSEQIKLFLNNNLAMDADVEVKTLK